MNKFHPTPQRSPTRCEFCCASVWVCATLTTHAILPNSFSRALHRCRLSVPAKKPTPLLPPQPRRSNKYKSSFEGCTRRDAPPGIFWVIGRKPRARGVGSNQSTATHALETAEKITRVRYMPKPYNVECHERENKKGCVRAHSLRSDARVDDDAVRSRWEHFWGGRGGGYGVVPDAPVLCTWCECRTTGPKGVRCASKSGREVFRRLLAWCYFFACPYCCAPFFKLCVWYLLARMCFFFFWDLHPLFTAASCRPMFMVRWFIGCWFWGYAGSFFRHGVRILRVYMLLILMGIFIERERGRAWVWDGLSRW